MRLISRAEYEAAKANFISTLNRLMTQRDLTPSKIQEITGMKAAAGEMPASISMQDLYHYNRGTSLPRGLKLVVLAEVLGVDTKVLVPQHVQKARVSRRDNGGYRRKETLVDVVPIPGSHDATLVTRITMPAHKAYAAAAVLRRQANREDLRREGNAVPTDIMEFNPHSGNSADVYNETRDGAREAHELEVNLDAALEQDLQRIQ